MSEFTPEQNFIFDAVAEGQTLRQIAASMGMTAGNVLRIATKTPEAIEQYSRARDSSSELFDADILTLASTVTSESSKGDRVRLEALKWVAARRAPKRYGERVQNDHTSSDGTMTPPAAIVTTDPMEAAKLYAEMMGKK